MSFTKWRLNPVSTFSGEDHVGPYDSTQDFIREYAQFRGRKIVSHQELETYKKHKKSKSRKMRKRSHNKANAADAKSRATD
jgi:hypothetical protein